MLRVGLTGGIGSGKSTIAGIFEVLGIPVSSADKEAKRVMNEDPVLKAQIVRHFGNGAYGNDGLLNRSYLAAEVFSNPARLELLNSLVHPATIAAGQKWLKEQETHAPYAIREAALIFESHTGGQLDYIIGVSAPAELRIRRTLLRDGITRDQVLQRMKNQLDEDAKMKLCDRVIINDDAHAVIPQVLEIHNELVRRSTGPVK